MERQVKVVLQNPCMCRYRFWMVCIVPTSLQRRRPRPVTQTNPRRITHAVCGATQISRNGREPFSQDGCDFPGCDGLAVAPRIPINKLPVFKIHAKEQSRPLHQSVRRWCNRLYWSYRSQNQPRSLSKTMTAIRTDTAVPRRYILDSSIVMAHLPFCWRDSLSSECLARITHARFCCNRGCTATTSHSAGVLATRALDVLFQVRLGSSWQCLKDTAGSRDTARSHLGGVHKHDALYSARREPRARAQT